MKSKYLFFLLGGGAILYWYLSRLKKTLSSLSYKIVNAKFNANKTASSLYSKVFINAYIEICNGTNNAVSINGFYAKFKISGTNDWLFDVKNDQPFKIGNRQCVQLPVEISIDSIKLLQSGIKFGKSINWQNFQLTLDYEGDVIADGIFYPIKDSVKVL